MTDTQRVVHLLGPETLAMREEAIPTPARGELLLRVDAATTCGTDLKVFLAGGHPRMLRPPCPFGHEMAGTVAATGGRVDGWREGDAVVRSHLARAPEPRDRALPLELALLGRDVAPLADRGVARADEQADAPALA